MNSRHANIEQIKIGRTYVSDLLNLIRRHHGGGQGGKFGNLSLKIAGKCICEHQNN